MEHLIGVLISLIGMAAATAVGFAHDRAFFPTVLMWVASYYLLFAAMGSDGDTMLLESLGVSVFVLCAMVGFRTNLWIVAGALAGHGLFDFVHHLLIDNSGVPAWWPGFCLTFDIVAGSYLAVLLGTGSLCPQQARPARAAG